MTVHPGKTIQVKQTSNMSKGHWYSCNWILVRSNTKYPSPFNDRGIKMLITIFQILNLLLLHYCHTWCQSDHPLLTWHCRHLRACESFPGKSWSLQHLPPPMNSIQNLAVPVNINNVKLKWNREKCSEQRNN